MAGLSKQEHERRLALYNQGMNDKEMADALFYSQSAILNWRRKHGLPAKTERYAPIDYEQVDNLLEAGMAPSEIAIRVGCARKTVVNRRAWLKNNSKGKGGVRMISEAEHNRRMKMYTDGLNDHQMAELCGVGATTIRNWRLRFGLRSTAPNGKAMGEPTMPEPVKMPRLGDKLRRAVEGLTLIDGRHRTGRVIWVHPKNRFFMLEFEGGIRECYKG